MVQGPVLTCPAYAGGLQLEASSLPCKMPREIPYVWHVWHAIVTMGMAVSDASRFDRGGGSLVP